jgi:hypothetical protein
VAAPPPFTDEEQAFLHALVEESVPFLVVGLAGAALQGAPAVTQDVDLWFADITDVRFQRVLRRLGITYVPPTEQNPPLLVGAGSELFDIVTHMHGLDSFEIEAQHSLRIRIGDVEVPVLPLERIIRSKRATNRPRDRAILPALEDTLRVMKHRRHSAEGNDVEKDDP